MSDALDQRDNRLKVRLLQTDPVLGDVEGNLARLDSQIAKARACDLVVTPELATHGYHLSDAPEAMPLQPDDSRLLGLGTHRPVSVVGFAEAFRHAWEILLLHTAIVLQSYVIFVNRSGQENQRDFWGGRRVVHPSGEVLATLGHDPGELDCVIDLDELRTLRRRWPLLQESRADLIAKATSQLADEES